MAHKSNGSATPTNGGSSINTSTSSNTFRSGLLTLRIFSGRNIALPPGTQMPDIIERAIANHHQQQQQRPKQPQSIRDSISRKRFWWLPYVVLEFDKNEILVDALAGEINTPHWMYKANLYVLRASGTLPW